MALIINLFISSMLPHAFRDTNWYPSPSMQKSPPAFHIISH